MVGNIAGVIAPKTPPPLAVGSAPISEHISAVGVDWITRDVGDYKECAVDKMLEELLYRCKDGSKPPPDKSTLLDDALKAVLSICNEGNDAQIIKNHLADLVNSAVEPQMHEPFIKAANCALRRLSQVDAPGLVPSKVQEDPRTILFHLNDPWLITQTHRGKESMRRPAVVIVSHESAQTRMAETANVHESVLCMPVSKFEWTEVRTTVEFKRKKTKLPQPPATYAVKSYDISEATNFMKYRRETNELEAINNKGDKECSSTGRVDGDCGNNKATEPESLDPVVQNGLYAAEMFSAYFARRSVISYIVENDMIYTWYFDRQGVIQCSGINFVQDLPRFMVLLLAMQRMPYAEWGYHTLRELKTPGDVRVEDEKIGEVDLKFDLTSSKRTTHFGLRGRTTTVFPVQSKTLSDLVPNLPHHNPYNATKELVAKLYWPEEERESEPDILKKVYEIAERDERVKHHVPEMVWFHKFEDTSTAKIRSALGLEDADLGKRVFYVIIFRNLEPITNLSDKSFLITWWHVVVCHYALWEGFVHHRDVSPGKLMVYRTSDGRWIGVLNDFDLSSTQDTPAGQERTGTLPFVALDLLTQEVIKSQVKHLYRHDAESFIWVLTWVSLCYEGGMFIGKGTPLNDWLKVDAIGCHEQKSSFIFAGREEMKPSQSHHKNWEMAQSCLDTISSWYGMRPSRRPMPEDHIVFQTWLEDKIAESKILSRELLDVRVEPTS